MTNDIRIYDGKKVFLGIDVHKRTYSVAAICDDVIVKKWSCKADPDSFVAQTLHFFEAAQIYSVYESGFSGFTLHRKLVEAGIENIVVAPTTIERAVGNKG